MRWDGDGAAVKRYMGRTIRPYALGWRVDGIVLEGWTLDTPAPERYFPTLAEAKAAIKAVRS